MASYSKCSLFPMPRKGTSNKSNYSTIVNSLVRTNISYAQVTQTPSNSTAPQQMAPHISQIPAINHPQTQALRSQNPPPINKKPIEKKNSLTLHPIELLISPKPPSQRTCGGLRHPSLKNHLEKKPSPHRSPPLTAPILNQ
ncbi:hypothetical protein TNIN_238071 [Trichonephila inaurata madagascariensis]|uniref:Uncharacterized protein n=1 Tax=Trichonephila inaurata madagascariensis TaxID=2747483 RepID=A0A8X6XLC6_9ARAC|nr:hypothetical protein TNIN_238071 [Trichonephila inaurata madagascariensis]